MSTTHTLTKAEYARFFAEINRKGDNMMNYAMGLMFLFGLFLGYFYQTYTFALLVGSINVSLYFVTKWLLPTKSLHRYVGSGVFALFMAQFIYQMHGMFEMHFFAFVGAALVISYRNWRLQLPNIVVVVVHHALFAYLQYTGMKEIYFTQMDYMSLQTFLFHGALAALIVGICGYWGYSLEQETVKEAINTLRLEEQVETMEKGIQFAEEISKGNLTVQYEADQSENALGKALIKMQESLLFANQKEQADKYINQGYTRVSDLLRKYQSEEVAVMADHILKEIVQYLQANQGAMFMVEEENNEVFLNQVATYAYARKKYVQKRVEIGEGLVGQCYLEKDLIYLTEIPESYVRITSGLGEALPRNIVIVPLMANEEVVGVLELATFYVMDEKQKNYLETVAETLASSMLSVRMNAQTRQLLDESNMATEQMRAQEEEMRQNMEELQATQEEMQRKAKEFEEIIEYKDLEIERLTRKLQQKELTGV
ncbi:GAF domain-containing protein [Cytophagales bacterium LB-30]|uniref:GAF domain-containing protein n=1 Tax=Shiella aurantiaca TaxID=3058365 RepID=A0ABT8F4F6_9BACT|nr:GAF domain-containing protein [Shiella aurantiaca]MDN4165340.1 GAF domain-containing protein [Shiella aurantiaca]